jgi:hypothetical protein
MTAHVFPPVAEQRCETCFYRRAIEGEAVALDLCCRYAPRPGEIYAARTPAIRWCGEWAPLEVQP